VHSAEERRHHHDQLEYSQDGSPCGLPSMCVIPGVVAMSDRACQGEPYRIVAILNRCRFQRIQALEAAIAFRAGRVAGPCSDCAAAGPGSRCDDHDRDLELIAGYDAR